MTRRHPVANASSIHRRIRISGDAQSGAPARRLLALCRDERSPRRLQRGGLACGLDLEARAVGSEPALEVCEPRRGQRPVRIHPAIRRERRRGHRLERAEAVRVEPIPHLAAARVERQAQGSQYASDGRRQGHFLSPAHPGREMPEAVCGLVARGVALSPPDGEGAEARVGEALVWLAAHTPVDALVAIDAAHPRAAAGLWAAVAGVVRRVDAGQAPLIGRAGALVAAAALRHVGSATARAEASALASEIRDPVVRSILRGSAPIDSGEVAAAGELVPAPRGPVAIVLLGFTGLLAVASVGRILARYLLQLRRPAEIRASARGVTILARTELLGRTVKQREIHVPLEAIARATREVRYPRLALYTGLVALALGSYFGVSLVVDGVRAGSPDLLGLGAGLVVVGLVLDFVLGSAFSSAQGRCRVVIVPRKGAAVAIGRVDPALATLALGRLQGRG